MFGGIGDVAVVVTAIDDATSATTISRVITSGSGVSKFRARYNLCKVNETDLLRQTSARAKHHR
jgi:hypothetical protein